VTRNSNERRHITDAPRKFLQEPHPTALPAS
jgi:hypothetical protein